MRYFTAAILFLLTSCHPLFCSWDSGYSQVQSGLKFEDIIGEYQLTQSSKEFLMSKGFSNQEFVLELNENGRYEFSNAPDIILDKDGHTLMKVMKLEGKWSLYCEPSCMMELENVTVEPFGERDGTLAILITIGDGDICEGVVYEKVKSKKSQKPKANSQQPL